MLTFILSIPVIIWIFVEECREKPSTFYLFIKGFAASPEGQRAINEHNKQKQQRRIAAARKKQIKKQQRQTRNYILAHYAIKSYNSWLS